MRQRAGLAREREAGAEAVGERGPEEKAARLGAEYECTAWSGKCLWPANSIVDLLDRVLPNEDGAARWDAKASPADVVAIIGSLDIVLGEIDR